MRFTHLLFLITLGIASITFPMNPNWFITLQRISKSHKAWIGAGAGTVATSLIGGSFAYWWANYHHPNALERRKFEIAQAEKAKRADQEHNERERLARIEREKQEARLREEAAKKAGIDCLLQLDKKYKPTFRFLTAEQDPTFFSLAKYEKEKEELTNFIRSRYADNPFSTFSKEVHHDLRALATHTMPAEKQCEFNILKANLEKLSGINNLFFNDLRKQEITQEEARKAHEAEIQRKKEKEELEIKALRLKVANSSTLVQGIQSIENSLRTMTAHHITDSAFTRTHLQTIEDKQKEVLAGQKELLQQLKKTEDVHKKTAEELKEKVKKTITEHSKPTVIQMPPATNPELHQPATPLYPNLNPTAQPSAPPLGT